MKTTLQIYLGLACIALMNCATMVAQNNNNLIVFSETGDRFYLVLNGLKYNQTPETNVKVTNLNAPTYKATIIFENGQPPLEANAHLMWEGNAVTNKEFTYAVVKKTDKYKLKFISQTDIGGVSAYGSNSVLYNFDGTAVANPNSTNTSINNNVNGNNVSTNVNSGGYNSNTTITTTTSSINGQPDNVAINVNGMNINVNTNGLANGVVSTSTVTSTTSTTTYNGSTNNTNYNQNNNQQVNNTGGCAYPMNEDSFRELTNSISKQSFEDAKLKIAKQAVSANCVSAGQVKKLMGSFTYEESKLDFAKYAYAYTYDKPNFFKINDAFTYSSSVDDLNNYLNTHK